MHIREVDSLSEIKHAGQLGKAEILHASNVDSCRIHANHKTKQVEQIKETSVSK